MVNMAMNSNRMEQTINEHEGRIGKLEETIRSLMKIVESYNLDKRSKITETLKQDGPFKIPQRLAGTSKKPNDEWLKVDNMSWAEESFDADKEAYRLSATQSSVVSTSNSKANLPPKIHILSNETLPDFSFKTNKYETEESAAEKTFLLLGSVSYKADETYNQSLQWDYDQEDIINDNFVLFPDNPEKQEEIEVFKPPSPVKTLSRRKSQNSFECKECKKSFKKLITLEQHEKTHSGLEI